MIAANPHSLLLGKRGASPLLSWIVGFMVLLAVLAAAGGAALNEAVSGWGKGLQGSVTVRVPAPEDAAEADALLESVLKVLRQGVSAERVRVLPETEIQALLKPWLGAQADLSGLPLPRLISLDLDISRDAETIRALQSRLAAAATGAVLDDHGEWRNRSAGLFLFLRLLAWSAVGVVAFCAILTVTLTTRSSMAAHRNIIEILCLLGARDGYIAGLFQNRAARAAALGSLPAAVAGLAAVLALAWKVAPPDSGELLPWLRGMSVWAGLLLIAPAAALTAALTARWTVLGTLRTMEQN